MRGWVPKHGSEVRRTRGSEKDCRIYMYLHVFCVCVRACVSACVRYYVFITTKGEAFALAMSFLAYPFETYIPIKIIIGVDVLAPISGGTLTQFTFTFTLSRQLRQKSTDVYSSINVSASSLCLDARTISGTTNSTWPRNFSSFRKWWNQNSSFLRTRTIAKLDEQINRLTNGGRRTKQIMTVWKARFSRAQFARRNQHLKMTSLHSHAPQQASNDQRLWSWLPQPGFHGCPPDAIFLWRRTERAPVVN